MEYKRRYVMKHGKTYCSTYCEPSISMQLKSMVPAAPVKVKVVVMLGVPLLMMTVPRLVDVQLPHRDAGNVQA